MVELQLLKLQSDFCRLQILPGHTLLRMMLVGKEKCLRTFLYYDNTHNIKHEQFLRQSEHIVLNSVVVYSRH